MGKVDSKQNRINEAVIQVLYIFMPEGYSEPYQRSKIRFFCKDS